MNRIYQGRVTKVESVDRKGNATGELPLEILWQHHELFQDAVNYYTLALTALGRGLPEKHPINQLRNRMAEAWEQFPKKTTAPAKGLRDSVCSCLGLDHSGSFADALGRIVTPCPRQTEVRSLAVALLAERASTLKPQKCANSYWGRFCDYLEKEPNWDYSAEELNRKAAADDWVAALWSEDSRKDIEGLAKALKLSSLVKCDPTAPKISEDEGRTLLTDAIAHLNGIIHGSRNDTKPAKRTNNWIRQNKDFAKEFLNANAGRV